MGAEVLQTVTTFIIALAAGLISMIIARRLHIVPIVLLLITGVLIGPEVLGIIEPQKLGATLEIIIQIGVAIILFEGALTLNYSQYRKVGRVIFKLLSIGVIVTWLFNAGAIFLLFGLPFTYALFLSSIIVVTGPTVIMPILRRVNLKQNLTHILHWEGILIDPIGIFLAIFSFELLISHGEGNILFDLFLRLGVGTLIGGLFGYIIALALNKNLVPPDMQNSFILMATLVTFAICNALSHESGVLGIVVAGIVISLTTKISIEEIKKFKLDLTDIFIAVIFILLSSNLNFDNVKRFFPEGLLLLLIITLVTRPINIWLCTWGSTLKFHEKVFLSWIAPRGIVAASIVTLFTFTLQANTTLDAAVRDNLWFMETFVFAVITFTVVLQGLSAPVVAKMLKVRHDLSKNWVIVGAHELSYKISKYLARFDKNVIILDSNKFKLERYKQMGVATEHGDSLAYDIFDREPFIQTGRLIALTDNIDLNTLICHHWKKTIPLEGLYKWIGITATSKEKNSAPRDPLASLAIWSNLSKPSILSDQLGKEERSLIIKKPEELTSYERENAIALMVINQDNEAIFSPDPNKKELAPLLTREWLFLAKKSFSLAPFLDHRHIFTLDKTFDQPTMIYDHLLDLLIPALNITTSQEHDNLIQNIHDQAKKETICIGNHVALFPILKKTFSEPLIALIKTDAGIDLNAYDKKPIHLFFFIFAHNADSLRYLSIISHISKIVTDKLVHKQMLDQISSEQLQQIIDLAISEKNI